MKREEILEELQNQNPWWLGKSVDLPKNLTERESTKEILEELSKEKITAVTGLRRVGKTTLLKIIIKKLLNGLSSKRICYFSFDLAKEISPRKIIKLYSEEILKQPLSKVKKKVYFFFDEIQKVENWGNEIKSIYDKKYNLKFVVTGSSSMNLTKGAGESLLGRIHIHKLNPFSFKEFLNYNRVTYPEVSFKEIKYPPNAEELRIKFNDYFREGGLPELYSENSEDILKQILDLTFFRDIVELFPVKRADVLKGVFRVITESTGQKINYSKFTRDLDTEYRTVKEYIQYLKDSFLIEESLPAKEGIKKLRKKPKVYVSDHAYTNLWECKKGLRAETIAFNHLKKLEKPHYKQKPEVDIILPENKYAFEIKYGEKVHKKDAQSLTELPEEYKLVLVTKERYDTWEVKGRKVRLIPLWLLCITDLKSP